MNKNKYSFLVLIGMFGVLMWSTIIICPRYNLKDGNATLGWDAAGYYWYLPSTFIYNDLAHQNKTAELIQKYNPGPDTTSGFGFKLANGNTVLKYPLGIALLESPFFFVGHSIAGYLGYPRDGLSKPYQASIQFGALLVCFIGLWMLRRLMLFYYSDSIVALCLFILVVGTNYLNYSAIDGALSHTWLFTLYVFLMWFTKKFYESRSYKSVIAIGSLCGLAIIMRPTDVVACIIPIFWGIKSFTLEQIRSRLEFFRKEYRKVLVAMVCAMSFLSLQLLYWKFVSGHWLVYSYQDQGFSWLHPHILSYTFSYRSGWITYTPVMIFSVLGFIPLKKYTDNWLMPAIFIGVSFYLVTSWDIWWYAGMGGRAMVQYYAVLMFPLASMLAWLLQSRFRSIIAFPLIIILMYINVWFTYQVHITGGLYDADGGMSREYYWKVIGRWDVPEIYQKLKDGKFVYENELPTNAKLIYANNLHYINQNAEDSTLTIGGKVLNSRYYNVPFINSNKQRWIRAYADFEIVDKEWTAWLIPQFILGVKNGDITVRETMIRPQRLMSYGERRTLWVDMKLPSNYFDTVNVHFWNPGSKLEMKVENLKIWVF